MSHHHLAALTLALLACSTPGTALAHQTARSGAYTVELVDEGGRQLPTFHHRGRTYVLGTHGARYLLRIRNQTGGRIEVVASVDGRDVVDGKPASVSRPGYLVEAWGQVVIDGFRLSHASVAAFRFATVESSYAARMGDARDVGVIGVAVFTEAPPPQPVPHLHQPDDHLSRLDGAAEEESAGAGGDASRSAQAPSATPPAEGLARSRPEAKKERPGLGTGFGEQHESQVVEVAFERSSSTPAAMLSVRYDDRPGLLALGIDVDGTRQAWRERERWLRGSAEPFRSDHFSEPPPGWTGQ